MVRITFFLLLSSCLYLAGCTDVDDTGRHDGNLTGVSFKMAAQTSSAALPYAAEQVNDIDGYMFDEKGVLARIYQKLPVGADGEADLIIPRIPGRKLYFIANTAGLLAGGPVQTGVFKESDFLKLLIEAETPAADKQFPVMTAEYVFQEKEEAVPVVKLARAQARIDLEVLTEDKDIKIHSLKIDNLCKSAYLFKQENVQSPVDAPTGTLEYSYDSPLTAGLHQGICHLYEQRGGESSIIISASIDGKMKIVSGKLPVAIRRNTVYKIRVHGVEGELKATISISDGWESEDSTTAEPDPSGIRVDSELSIMGDGVEVNSTGDTLYLPPWKSESTLVLRNALDDSEFTIDGHSSGISFQPLPGTRSDLQGRSFLVSSSERRPNAAAEYIYLNIHSKDKTDYYSGRLVVVVKPNSIIFEGELLSILTESFPFECRFGDYTDGVLGRIRVPAGSTLSATSEDKWLRVVPVEEGLYEVQAGYKPNDPKADGREQECVLTVADAQGKKGEYVVSRLNYGLPVVLMDGTYWCRFNLRGDSKKFTDQVQIAESAAIVDDAEYWQSCTNEEYLRTIGSGYKGRNTKGMTLVYDGGFYYEGYGSITNPAAIETGPATSHCPRGYQIPATKDFKDIIKNGGVTYANGKNSVNYTTGKGKQATITRYSRPQVLIGDQPLENISYHQITIDGHSLVFGGLGHQYNNGATYFASSLTLWASITGNSTPWSNDVNFFKPNAAHNSGKTRTVRCIKSTPVFLIE